MKNTIVFLILLIALANANILFSEEEYRKEFMSWLTRFEKKYESMDFIQRFAIFKTNMDYVHEWNSKNQETKLGLNIFADLTNLEYRHYYLGTHVNAKGLLGTPGTHEMSHNLNKIFGDSDVVDWRTKGAVSHVKDQGQCGSCWSFSTTGSTEGAHQIKTGTMVTLSEQNLVDCSTKQGNMGCQGGMMSFAFDYIIENGGIDTESSYPYDAQNGKACLFNKTNVGATISSYKNITAGSEKELEDAVRNNGPVSVAIDASHNSFQLYTSGIYYEDKCSSENLDHGVLVVGFGSGDPVNAVHTYGGRVGRQATKNLKAGFYPIVQADDTKNYWIVKNSWSPSWGDKGFIMMSKDRNNNCGIATCASYPIV